MKATIPQIEALINIEVRGATKTERMIIGLRIMHALGSGKHPSMKVQEMMGSHRNLIDGIILGLKPFFNRHKELGYHITGSGAYDPKGDHSGHWLKFTVP